MFNNVTRDALCGKSLFLPFFSSQNNMNTGDIFFTIDLVAVSQASVLKYNNTLECKYINNITFWWLSANLSGVQCFNNWHTNGLVQGCHISIANTLEILQSCTKPSKIDLHKTLDLISSVLFNGAQILYAYKIKSSSVKQVKRFETLANVQHKTSLVTYQNWTMKDITSTSIWFWYVSSIYENL